MPSDLTDYLASRYLVADPKPTKKRKRNKQAAAASGLLITDEDDSAWGTKSTAQDEDADGPVTVTGASSEFRKAKKSSWKSVGDKAHRENESDAADAIIASAAAEQSAAQEKEDEMPVVDSSSVVKMSDGTHAGLQSAATVSAQLKLRQQEEREEFERHRKSGKEEETVYRDATGRRIDISMRRAEARKAAAEAEEKERQAKEALKGEVQQEEARKRRERLEDAKLMTFARTADDTEMNEELKEKDRWNDPMMQFMTEKKSSKTKGKSKRRPIYQGGAPPNRYGIKPGYRWDGVDRSNGFEAERFKAINRREMNKGLEYSWQMDE